MSTLVHERVELARAGANPRVICRVSSGWMVLENTQLLRGHALLLSDPIAADLNSLDAVQRSEFLRDMTILGDALLRVTDAYRITSKSSAISNRLCTLTSHRATWLSRRSTAWVPRGDTPRT